MSSLFDEIRTTLADNDVVLYMKGEPQAPMCGFSATVVRILNDLNVDFYGVNVLKDMELREAIKTFTNWPTIPQLYIKEEFIGGSDIVTEMYQNKELHSLLKEKGIIS